MEWITECLGWAGAALVLGAYALLSFGKLESGTLTYHSMNIAGSILLTVYSILHHALANVAVNIIWISIGIIASLQILKSTVRLRND